MLKSAVIADSSSPVPEYELIITEKGGQERRQVFNAAELTLGRVQGNDLVLPKGNVSKRHARILYREGRFIVTDLNSTNGTYVNRRRITQAQIIRQGDKVYVGDFVIRVEPVDGEVADFHSSPSSVPDIAPAPFGFAAQQDAGSQGAAGSQAPALPDEGSQHSVMPGWERSSVVDDISRPSSGPPPRFSDPPAAADKSSTGSQKVADMAAGHRRAVGQVIEAVLAEIGDPPLDPDEAFVRRVQQGIATALDSVFAEDAVPVGTSAEAVADQASQELLKIGPLEELLDDSTVSSFSASRFDELVGTRDGRQQSFPPGFSSVRMFELALRRLCARSGEELGDDSVKEFDIDGGARMAVLRGGVAPDGPLITLRKPRRIGSSLDDLVRRGTISRTMATFLGQCVSARLNILVVGPRDEGARTVLSALCSTATHDRVISISDFDDVSASSSGAIRLDLTAHRGDVRRLFDVASGLSQARLAVTLTRPDVTAATLEAVGTGTSGILASLRASNLDRGLLRLPADIAAERPGVSLEAAAGWVLSGFDLAIEVARLRDGRVRVLRIAELGRDGAGGIEGSDIFRFIVSRVAAGGAVEGHFNPSGRVPRLAAQLQALGMRVETSLFSRPPSR